MKETKKKPKWEKPKLIVLVRGNPEERVLDVCKANTGIEGPNAYSDACDDQEDPCYAGSPS